MRLLPADKGAEMTENELKEYWYVAYGRALSMLLHPDKVTGAMVAAGVKHCGDGVFNRLFCLTVWQEVKLAKTGKPSIPCAQYKNAVTDIWKIFRRFADGDGSDAYWDKLVEELGIVMNRYGCCQFIINLAVHVTLEAIEDIQRKKRAAA